jgi:hypothetical protein
MEIETNRQSMNYNNGKIYSIRSYQTDNIYVGSTTQSLSKRLSKHKAHFNIWKNNNKKYYSSFEILKYDDAYIELIEEFSCENRMELEKREGEIIRATENCVNKIIAGRTNKQYRADNKAIIAERKKQYYESNKEKLNAKYTCECGGKYTHEHKSHHLKCQKHLNFINQK